MAFIYVITNDVNGKQYVGKTDCTIEYRFKEHISDSKKRACEKRPLYNAMNKYGIEHFHIAELEECLSECASEREQFWVDKLDTYNNGYNATRGGDGSPIHDYKQIASKYEEMKSLVKVASFFHCDTKVVKKACLANNITTLTNQESIALNLAKSVLCLDNNACIIKKFDSLTHAAEWLKQQNPNIKSQIRHIVGHISQNCQGKRKSAYGYIWKYN